MSSPSGIAELRELLDTPDSLNWPEPSPSCSSAHAASFSEPESAQPFALSQEVAEALYTATEAKAALEFAKAQLACALEALDDLVEAGALAEKGLPIVNGFTVYRQEGRPSWSYPPAIKQLEAQLKEQKALAEQLGEAVQKRNAPFWTIKEASALRPREKP